MLLIPRAIVALTAAIVHLSELPATACASIGTELNAGCRAIDRDLRARGHRRTPLGGADANDAHHAGADLPCDRIFRAL